MSDAQRDDDDGRLERLEEIPLVGGFVGGIASFVGGYVLFFGLLTGTGELGFSRGVVTALRSAAQLFYNAFNVPTYSRQVLSVNQSGQLQEQIIERWVNSVTGIQQITQTQRIDGQVMDTASGSQTAPSVSQLPELVYLAVPVLAVLVTGLVLGYWFIDSEADDPNTIALQSIGGGVAMAAGFLVLSLGLSFVLVRSGTNAFLHPARLEAVIYGIAYPLIGGTAGIAVGQLAQSDHGDRGSSRDDDDSDAVEDEAESEV